MKEDYYHNKSTGYGMGHTRMSRILNLVGPEKNQKILDVACASGYFGRKLKDCGHYVAGIEISREAAKAATSVLDKVYEFDIEEPWPDELQQNQFDLIILAEILEHTFDPVLVLNYAQKCIKHDGKIIITTPNFMTWTNRLLFLLGKFKYDDQGMFDFGHIRWFTYNYLKEVLNKAGFEIEKENHIIFPGKLTKILKFWPSLFAFQFILRVKIK